MQRTRHSHRKQKKAEQQKILAKRLAPDLVIPRIIDFEGLKVTYNIGAEGPPPPDGLPDRLQFWRDLVDTDPSRAAEEMEPWVERFPEYGMLANFLALAYMRANRTQDVDRLIDISYERTPDYLFARTNKANALLLLDQPENALRVLDGTFDLGVMYPHRKIFHITEVCALLQTEISYAAAIEDFNRARERLAVLRKLSPENGATRQVEALIMVREAATRFRRMVEEKKAKKAARAAKKRENQLAKKEREQLALFMNARGA